MPRDYTLPDLLPGESGFDWCRRAADAIPPEAIVRALVAHLVRREEAPGRRGPRRPAWSTIGALTGHGSGASAAIVAKYQPREPETEDRPR